MAITDPNNRHDADNWIPDVFASEKFTRTLKASSVCSQSERGFTVIEMLVAIAVLIIFMSGMLINQDDFDSTVRLRSLTRDVALVYRQAQTYGASGRRQSNTLQIYGVSLANNATSTITLYREDDVNNPNGYDNPSEAVEESVLPDNFRIQEICTASSGAPESCGSGTTETNDRLDVYFRRPSLESNFLLGGSDASGVSRVIMEVEHTPTGQVREVIVDSTGYITTP